MSVLSLCAFARASHAAGVAALARSQPAFAGLHSIDGGGIAAVLMVDGDDAYSVQNLADQAWVMRAAALQAEVLAALLGQGPVIPVRFGTLFASHVAVKDLLLRHQEVLLAALSELDGKAEWSVRAVCDTQRLSAWLSRQSPSAQSPQSSSSSLTSHADSGPGRRYLEQQREAQRSAVRVRDWLAAQSDTLHAIADAHALRFQLQPQLQQLPLSSAGGNEGTAFWGASLLVDDDDAAALRSALEQCQQDWPADAARLVLAGPWPPYSFGPALPG